MSASFVGEFSSIASISAVDVVLAVVAVAVVAGAGAFGAVSLSSVADGAAGCDAGVDDTPATVRRSAATAGRIRNHGRMRTDSGHLLASSSLSRSSAAIHSLNACRSDTAD